jgi:hypothetical protein
MGVLLWREFGIDNIMNQCFGNQSDISGKGRQMPVVSIYRISDSQQADHDRQLDSISARRPTISTLSLPHSPRRYPRPPVLHTPFEGRHPAAIAPSPCVSLAKVQPLRVTSTPACCWHLPSHHLLCSSPVTTGSRSLLQRQSSSMGMASPAAVPGTA